MKFSALGAEDNDGEQLQVDDGEQRGRPRCQDGYTFDVLATIDVLVVHRYRIYKLDYRIDESRAVTYSGFLKQVEDVIGTKPLSMSFKDVEYGCLRPFDDSCSSNEDDKFYSAICMAMKNGNHLQTLVSSCELYGASQSDDSQRGGVPADGTHPRLTMPQRRDWFGDATDQDHFLLSGAMAPGPSLPLPLGPSRLLQERKEPTWLPREKDAMGKWFRVPVCGREGGAAGWNFNKGRIIVDTGPDPCEEIGSGASVAESQEFAFVSNDDHVDDYEYGHDYNRRRHDKKSRENLDYKIQVEALTALVKKVGRGVETLLLRHAPSQPFSTVQNQLETVQELLQQLVDANQAALPSRNQRQTPLDAAQRTQAKVDEKEADFPLSTCMVTESEGGAASAKPLHLIKENFLQPNCFPEVHEGIQCNLCHEEIIGTRYMCGNCVDFDLCAACEDSANCHFRDHVFIKIRKPITQIEFKKKHGKVVPLLECTLYDRISARLSQLETPVLKSSVVDTSDASVTVPTNLVHNLHEMIRPIKSIMDAEFMEDETVPDGTKFHPGQCFTKSWRIINSGIRPWNEDTSLKFLWGTKGFVPNMLEVVVPPLLPKQRGKICVNYVSPDKPGFYESHWNFVHKGHFFGHRIWCSIEVIDPNEVAMEDAKEISDGAMEIQEPENGETARIDANLETAEYPMKIAAVKDDSIIAGRLQEGQKTKFVSQTATPNNTPFVLSPPKSPEPFDLEEEILLRSFHDAEDMLLKEENPMTVDSEFTSVASVCSTDSEGEYVVVPMPSCFVFDQAEFPTNAQQRESRSSSDSSLMFIRSDGEEIQPDELPKMDFVLHTDHDYTMTSSSCEHLSEIPTTAAAASLAGSSSGMCGAASVKSSAKVTYENAEMNITDVGNTTGDVLNRSTDPSSGEPTNEIPVSNEISSDTDDGGASVSTSAESTESRDSVASEEPANSGDSARMVNVLPEGLVSAAATLFNSARSAFEALQRVPSPPMDNRSGLPEPAQMRGIRTEPIAVQMSQGYISQLLKEMGFHDTVNNDRLMNKHNGELEKILDELFKLEDKDWFDRRH